MGRDHLREMSNAAGLPVRANRSSKWLPVSELREALLAYLAPEAEKAGIFPESVWAQGSSNSGGLYLIFSSSHILNFTYSHLHIFTSSHLHICSSSHLHIFSSSHLHILTSSHPHIFTFSPLAFLPSCPHIFTSSPLVLLPSPSFLFLFWRRGQGQCRRDGTKYPFARNEVRSPKTGV